jgi:hypothetical protein
MILFAKAMHSHVSSVDGWMGNNVEHQIKIARVDDSRASKTIKINCQFAKFKKLNLSKDNPLVDTLEKKQKLIDSMEKRFHL